MSRRLQSYDSFLVNAMLLLLSTCLLLQHVQAQIPVNGLVGYYSFNGNTAERSGKSSDAIAYGSPVFVQDRFGHSARAMSFDGLDDYLVVPEASKLNFYGEDFTISLWVNEADRYNGMQCALISKRNMDASKKRVGYALSITGNEHPWGSSKLLYQLGGGANSYALSGDTTLENTWYHLVFVYNKLAQTGKFYVNSQLIYTSGKLAPPISNSASMYIGGDSLAFSFAQGYLFSGILDDIRFYNRLLDDTDITNLYEAESCTGPIIKDISMTLCAGDSAWAGNAYQHLSGIYKDTLLSEQGCDSIVTTTLDVKPYYFFPVDVSICEGESILINNISQTAPGIYYDTLLSPEGCEQIFEMHLTVNPSYLIPMYDTILKGDTLKINDTSFVTAGVYFLILQTLQGCDSIIELHLTIDDWTKFYSIKGRIITEGQLPMPGTVELYKSKQGTPDLLHMTTTITANTFVFEQVEEGNYFILARPDISSIYMPTYYWKKQDINQAYEMLVDGNIGKVDIYMIRADNGIHDQEADALVDIFPNPAVKSITWSSKITEKMQLIVIMNTLGQELMVIENTAGLSNVMIDITSLSPGLYLLKSVYSEGAVVKRFIKK